MSQDFQDNLKAAIALAVDAKAAVLSKLEGPELALHNLRVGTDFDRMIAGMAHVGGLVHTQTAAEAYEPILGDNDVTVLAVEDLNPAEEDKALFLGKVSKLWADIEVLSSEQVLADYKSKEDVLVVRGVAKRAGLKDYADAELNIFFIDGLKNAVAKKKLDDEAEAKQRTEIEKQEAIDFLEKEIASANTRRNAFSNDLNEAQEKLEKAKSDSAKAKAGELVTALSADLDAANTHIATLTKNLAALRG